LNAAGFAREGGTHGAEWIMTDNNAAIPEPVATSSETNVPPVTEAEVASVDLTPAAAEEPIATPSDAEQAASVHSPASTETTNVDSARTTADSGLVETPASDALPTGQSVDTEPSMESAFAETEEPAASDAGALPSSSKKPRKPKAVSAYETTSIQPDTPSDTPAPPPSTSDEGNSSTGAEPAPENKKRWYAVKIQSGREESIKAAIERKVRIEGLEQYFGQIVIPVEEVIVKKKVRVKNKKTGEITTQEKNVVKYNKKFPGYLFAEVEFNNEILYVFRETSGVGDFVGVNTKKTQGAVERTAPAPMTDAEVQSMLTGIPSPDKKRGKPGKVVVKLDVEKGDKVRIKNGAFAGNEGEVKAIIEAKDPTDTPKVTVEVTIWGRPVPIELDYWEVDKV
jgi:transcriptional antiterminator NusG